MHPVIQHIRSRKNKKVPLKDGTWEVHEGMANHAKETGLISKTGGNVGIYAHDKKNGFANIKKAVEQYVAPAAV